MNPASASPVRRPLARWQVHAGRFSVTGGDRTLVMGILNVTPDSFSDGGRHLVVDAAVKRAREMIDEGADLIDIGGESTRPRYEPVNAAEELRRVVPVLERLAPDCPVPISIDTTKPDVAREAIALGATIVNDQWGLHREPALAALAAEHGLPVVAMHNQQGHTYTELMGDIIAFLRRSIDIATAAGVPRDQVIVDPGFGFGKTAAQNLEVLRRLGELKVVGCPILIGTSRKSTIGKVLDDAPSDDRVEGTAATVALGIAFGADIVRVHDVRQMRRVARMADAIVRPQRESGESQ